MRFLGARRREKGLIAKKKRKKKRERLGDTGLIEQIP